MSPVAPDPDWRLAAVLAVLLAVAVVTARWGGLGVAREEVTAALRAVVQLTVVSLLLVAILEDLAWSFVFVAVMFAVAAATSQRRVGAPVAELPVEVKNANSHRGRAARQMVEQIRQNWM